MDSPPLGAPLESFHRVAVSPGSISAIRYDAGAPPLVFAINSRHGPLTGTGTDA